MKIIRGVIHNGQDHGIERHNMKTFSSRETVGTTATKIFQCRISELQHVEVYAVGALEIGLGGVTTGKGIPLTAGESRSWSHLDFRKDDKQLQNSDFVLYAVSAAGTTAHIFGVRA